MERISGVWEIELQAVLEINKLGHRKRILYSVGATSPKAEKQLMVSLHRTIGSSNKLPSSNTKNGTTDNSNEQRRSHRKNRQAPNPPGYKAATSDSTIKPIDSNLEIRDPSELLLGFPTGLTTQWRHRADVLVHDSVKYEVNVNIFQSNQLNQSLYIIFYYLLFNHSTWDPP